MGGSSRISLGTSVRHLGWILVAAFILLLAPAAGAITDEERAGARAAATAGAQSYADGNYQEAADYFARAEAIVHSPVHLLYIARSQVQLGELVKARENYIKVLREAAAADASDVAVSAGEEAEPELAELDPRIPKVTIKVTGAPEGAVLKVTADGAEVPPSLVGIPQPMDPGQHEFRAEAQGYASETVPFELAEGTQQQVVLELKADPNAVGPAPPDTGAQPQTGTPATTGSTVTGPPPPAPTADQGKGLPVPALVALGVGVVGVGLGTVFALQSKSKLDEANDLCIEDGTRCDFSVQPQVESLEDDAASAKTLATVGFIVGGVGIAAGATLWILHATSSSSGSAGITPYIGPGSAGVVGRF